MLNSLIMHFAYFLIYLVYSAYSTELKANNCKIKMASDRMAFAKESDQLIYNEGILNSEKFGEKASLPYTTPFENFLEYFYIFEDKIVNVHNHDKIVFLFKVENVCNFIRHFNSDSGFFSSRRQLRVQRKF